MGKLTCFCMISGCCPEIQDIMTYSLDDDWPPEDCLITRQAIQVLADDEDEREGRSNLTLIGVCNKHGEFVGSDFSYIDYATTPPTSIKVVHGFEASHDWDLGFVSRKDEPEDSHIVSYGGSFFVQTYMLPILHAATDGRVTPFQLWKLVMQDRSGYLINCVNYEGIEGMITQFPGCLGRFDRPFDDEDDTIDEHPLANELRELEAAVKTVEVMATVLPKGGYWMWMRPDRFPVSVAETFEPPVCAASPSTVTVHQSRLSSLPVELLTSIVTLLSIPELLALVSSCRATRITLLGSLEARDHLAKAYLRTNSPWAFPVSPEEQAWWDKWTDRKDVVGWNYLRACYSWDSWSMKNRRRVWKVSRNIGEWCDRLGL